MFTPQNFTAFPIDPTSKRRCPKDLLSKFPFVKYSIHLDAVFCVYCFVANRFNRNIGSIYFVNRPYRSWKNINNLLRSHCSAQKTFATNNHNQNRIDINKLVQVLTVMSVLITVFNCVIYVSVHIMFEHKKWLDTSALFNGENDVCIWDTEFNE